MIEKKPLRVGQRRFPGLGVSLVIVCMGVTLHPIIFLLAVAGVSDPAQPPISLAAVQSMESKIRALEDPGPAGVKSLPPIVVKEDEANAYLKYHGHEFLPAGVRDPALHITPERVFGSATIDFSELARTASANNGDWGPRVLAAMFKGSQRIAAAGRVESQNSQAKVKIETVVVGTSTIPPWLVDFMLDNYVGPRYKVDLSKPMALSNHIVRIELGTGQATFIRSPGK